MSKSKSLALAVLIVVAAAAVGWRLDLFRQDARRTDPVLEPARPIGRMVELPGGTFRMGAMIPGDPDEQPVHDVTVDPFRMDEHEVTNRQFAEFVSQTGYETTARQRGWSYVFDRRQQEWVRCEGADWRHPGGPDTSLDGRHDYPVVHVSWLDAAAYARWSGKQLPTEAQWEYAARAGLRDANYPWGRQELIDGEYQANYRQHGKPIDADGFAAAAPVRSFRPNRYGLYDMSGNVWEWCADWYDAGYYRGSPPENPPGPSEGQHRVQRGGSWLSPENFRLDYHVSTRDKHLPEATYQHVGFRCIRAIPPRQARSSNPGSNRY